jgi:hypothetical protein
MASHQQTKITPAPNAGGQRAYWRGKGSPCPRALPRVRLFPPHRTTQPRATIKWSGDGCQKRLGYRCAGSGKPPDTALRASRAIQSKTCAERLLFHARSISVVRRTRAEAKARLPRSVEAHRGLVAVLMNRRWVRLPPIPRGSGFCRGPAAGARPEAKKSNALRQARIWRRGALEILTARRRCFFA